MEAVAASRESLIRKLVTTLHLSVAERKQLRPAPREREIVTAIVEELLRRGFFPRPLWREGEPCGDGTVLEVLPDGTVRAQHQVATAWMSPTHLDSIDFPNAKSAAAHLVSEDFSRGIDGVRIRFGWRSRVRLLAARIRPR
jgi:hypothetical protein